MTKDKQFCSSSYLLYRYVYDTDYSFDGIKKPLQADIDFQRDKVRTADDLIVSLKKYVDEALRNGKCALALSGGIDSAILARLLPAGTKAYTFRCIVPGKKTIDETEQARYWADICDLDHEIIDIQWSDVELAADILMEHKGAPIHSIETQIYLCAKKAKKEGMWGVIFGENADIIYGGMDGLLSKDWTFGEFVERYSYVMPYKVLKSYKLLLDPFKEFEIEGRIDGHDFINKYFRQEALGTYTNACETVGVQFVGPYSRTVLDAPIDYHRIRNGDTKYIVREAFNKLFQGERLPQKIPMPRPVGEWFIDWKGPTRDDMLPHCTDSMTGDQKWMVWCLERYLNNIEKD